MGTMFSLANKTKSKLPSLPFHQIKEKILGKKFELSLVFIGDTLSKKMNLKWRRKKTPTNILSFSLSPCEGEIFINLRLATKQAKKFERNSTEHIKALVIHGLLHLKGMTHSSKMESEEAKFYNFFSNIPSLKNSFTKKI